MQCGVNLYCKPFFLQSREQRYFLLTDCVLMDVCVQKCDKVVRVHAMCDSVLCYIYLQTREKWKEFFEFLLFLTATHNMLLFF